VWQPKRPERFYQVQDNTSFPTEAILSSCCDRLMRAHHLLRVNMPRSEHPSLRERRVWKMLDAIREVAESIEMEVRQGYELAADRQRKAVRR
jgi:hypothetical protein